MVSRGVIVGLVCMLAIVCAERIVIDDVYASIETASVLQAGVAKVAIQLPIGTPLAGYNHGARRVPYWPIPEFKNYTTFMTPSQGYMTSMWAKALVIDNGSERIVFTTIDGIGSDENVNKLAYDIAVTMGFNIPMDNIIFSASHSHSGPGAVSADSLWALAPATDLLVPELQRQLATYIAESMVQAADSMQPVVMDVGTGDLIGVTQNRRAKISPYVQIGTIDPHLGVIRVDTLDGKPLATLWNFAMHGVCFGPDNLLFSSDINGGSNEAIEDLIGGVALYVNADAGDIDPTAAACSGMPNYAGAPIIAKAVQGVRESLKPSASVEIKAYSVVVDFGPTDLNATFQRFDNCSNGGFLDICSFCAIVQCDYNGHLYSSWIENTPRFTGFSFVINGKSSIVVSIPGEALVELGWQIRNDTLDMGYDTTLLAGYSNAHMGYFATPDEYDIGGYESQLTFWGINTSAMIRNGCYLASSAVIPNSKK